MWASQGRRFGRNFAGNFWYRKGPKHVGKISEHQKPGDHPNFQEKLSRSEKAILGALGAFQGILGAALGVQKIILGMRNPILGMASHYLRNAKTTILTVARNAKTTILGATPGAIPGIDGNPHGRFSFARAFSLRVSSLIGVVPTRQRAFSISELKSNFIGPTLFCESAALDNLPAMSCVCH